MKFVWMLGLSAFLFFETAYAKNEATFYPLSVVQHNSRLGLYGATEYEYDSDFDYSFCNSVWQSYEMLAQTPNGIREESFDASFCGVRELQMPIILPSGKVIKPSNNTNRVWLTWIFVSQGFLDEASMDTRGLPQKYFDGTLSGLPSSSFKFRVDGTTISGRIPTASETPKLQVIAAVFFDKQLRIFTTTPIKDAFYRGNEKYRCMVPDEQGGLGHCFFGDSERVRHGELPNGGKLFDEISSKKVDLTAYPELFVLTVPTYGMARDGQLGPEDIQSFKKTGKFTVLFNPGSVVKSERYLTLAPKALKDFLKKTWMPKAEIAGIECEYVSDAGPWHSFRSSGQFSRSCKANGKVKKTSTIVNGNHYVEIRPPGYLADDKSWSIQFPKVSRYEHAEKEAIINGQKIIVNEFVDNFYVEEYLVNNWDDYGDCAAHASVTMKCSWDLEF